MVCVEYYGDRVCSMWGRGCFVCVYVYIFWRVGARMASIYVFSTDGFVLTCLGGSSKKLNRAFSCLLINDFVVIDGANNT
jgi:hypothetical protein